VAGELLERGRRGGKRFLGAREWLTTREGFSDGNRIPVLKAATWKGAATSVGGKAEAGER